MSPYPQVFSEFETIARAAQGTSIARFGDGELKLCLGRHAKTQAHDPKLAGFLRACLRDTASPCLPCIPPAAGSGSPKEPFWADYRSPRFTGLYAPEIAYGSCWVTRPDSAPWISTPAYWAECAKMWAGREIVLVGSSGKALQTAELEGARSVEHIDAPRQNAWADSARLYERLKHERRTVILCLGATATALAYRLAIRGVHALDLGHMGMFMRKAMAGADATICDQAMKDAP